ncbi:MAG: hypothetical protein ACLQU3_00635 [Limisphaerales bacterium]
MSNTHPISEHSRQELYDLIWSTPASNLAAHFGISDVAIAKHCKKLNVPRPTRGYWAKVAAGHKPRKKPLPPTANEAFKQAAESRLPKNLRLPGPTEALLPLASDLVNAITKAKLDHYKRAHLQDPRFPVVSVSKNLADRVGQAFHVLLMQLEPLDICFRKFQGTYEGGYFQRRRDRLSVIIAEDIVRPDASRVSAPWWQSAQANEKPSGFLAFSFKPHRWISRDIKQWSESARLPFEATLAQIVGGIRKHFLDAQEQREQWAIESARRQAEWLLRRREWEKQEAIRLQQEKERKHTEALAAAVRARKAALLKAAKNWRRSHTLLEFIDACETRWKSQSPALSAEHIGWLTWAKEIATTMSPFAVGYPGPANDGAFDSSSIPLGGPYPDTRNFK